MLTWHVKVGTSLKNIKRNEKDKRSEVKGGDARMVWYGHVIRTDEEKLVRGIMIQRV